MPRTVRSAHALDPGPADAAARGLARGPRLWLPDAARRCVDGWLLPVGVGRITRTVHLEIGPPTRAEGQVARVLGWVPLRPGAAAVDRALPSFQGRLRLDLGTDDHAGTGVGFGGPTGERIVPRPSSLELFAAARADLEAAGAEVVETDFPVVSNYDGDRAGAPTVRTRGLLPEGYLDEETAPAMLSDLEDAARSNPATFLGTSFAAGLALGRFLRASEPEPTNRAAGRP